MLRSIPPTLVSEHFDVAHCACVEVCFGHQMHYLSKRKKREES